MAATPTTDDSMARRKQVLQDLVTTIEGADTNVYHEIDGDDLGQVTFDTYIQVNDVELAGTVSSMWTHEFEINVADHLGQDITHAVHQLKEAVDALPDSIESKPVPEEAQAIIHTTANELANLAKRMLKLGELLGCRPDTPDTGAVAGETEGVREPDICEATGQNGEVDDQVAGSTDASAVGGACPRVDDGGDNTGSTEGTYGSVVRI